MKFLNNGMVKIKVTKANFQHLSHISRFKKIDNTTTLDMVTGELIEHKTHSSIRNKSSLYRGMYEVNELILHNFKGEEEERLIILQDNRAFTEIKNQYNDFRYFIAKLERRIKDIIFIKVTQFSSNNHLYYELWIRKTDHSKLNINEEMLSELWKYGKVLISKIDNIYELADYVRNGQSPTNFPPNVRLYSYSTKTIEKPKKYVTYNAESERILELLNSKKISSVTESFRNKNKTEVQRINYETYALEGGIEFMILNLKSVPPKIATAILENTFKSLEETFSVVEYSKTDKQILSNTFKMAYTHIRNMRSYDQNN